jgi:polysaccharide biosynthesis protein PslH
VVGGATGGAFEVLDEHNLWFELRERRAAAERSPVRRALLRLEQRVMAQEERRAWRRVHASLFVSEREAAIARARGAHHVHVVPNGVDLDWFRPSDGPAGVDRLVFVGLLSYGPNRDAVEYFVDHVLPLLARRRPAVTLDVIGRDAPESLLQRAGPHVRFLGAVDDIRPHLASAAAVVAPIRYGSGTRIKILEAMGAARPVIATTAAAEGLEVRDGEHLLLADTPLAFAGAVAAVLEDHALAEQLAARARLLVERRYSWHAIGRSLVDRYEEWVEPQGLVAASGPS